MANILHDKVFNFCEVYRASHPDFLFWLRERNTKGKLDEGIWIQGNENYAFVGLYNANGGPKSSRSIGLIFTTDGENIKFNFEVAFLDDEEQKKINFYKLVVTMIGGNLKTGKISYEKELSANNGFEAATNFLDTIKPHIDALVEQNNLQQIFIIPKKFNNNLQAKLQKRT